jgi:predicted component of type VI protein secretion system
MVPEIAQMSMALSENHANRVEAVTAQLKNPHLKLSLVVRTPGKYEGKVIPIGVTPFRIGRDPQCHLRPANPFVSKQHCALIVQDGRVFIKDSSTNGTFVDGRRVQGEVELKDSDRIEIGPLAFGVRIEAEAPVEKPAASSTTQIEVLAVSDTKIDASVPATQKAGRPEDHTHSPNAAPADRRKGQRAASTHSPDVPQGDTLKGELPNPSGDSEAGDHKHAHAARTSQGDTSLAAQKILEAYIRKKKK